MSAKTSTLTMPADLAAENEIVALLLRGDTTPERLRPLEPRHYFSPTHSKIHEAARAAAQRGEVVGLDAIAERLQAWGVIAGDFRGELEEIRLFAPLLTAQSLEVAKQSVIELWGRRSLIDCLVRTANALSVGDCDCLVARARLEGCLQEISGFGVKTK